MNINSAKGYIFPFLLFITFLICLTIAIGVALFHSKYFADWLLDYKSSQISEKLINSTTLNATAKNIMLNRDDIGYLKIFSKSGVLEEKFGSDETLGTKEVILKMLNGKSIVLGLKTDEFPLINTYALSWSLIIGIILAIVLVYIMSIMDPQIAKLLKKLQEAMTKLSKGDYEVRLEIDSLSDQKHIKNIYQSFNMMAKDVEERYKKLLFISDIESPIDSDYKEGEKSFVKEDKDQEPEIRVRSGVSDLDLPQSEDQDSRVITQTNEIKNLDEQDEKIGTGTEPEEEVKHSLSVTTVEYSEEAPTSDLKDVSVLVVKVEDLGSLPYSEHIRPCSRIIASYGGNMLSSPPDECIGVFKASDGLDYIGLRAACAAVEILKELVDIAMKRKSDNKGSLKGKVGINIKVTPSDMSSNVLNSVDDLIEDARHVCEVTKVWKLSISSELYEQLKDFVEATECVVDGRVLYSVTGVEHGVVHPKLDTEID